MLMNTIPPVIAMLSGPHLLIVLIVVLILFFGASRIPEIAKALGKAIREFKKAGKEIDDDIQIETKAKENQKDNSEKKPEAKC